MEQEQTLLKISSGRISNMSTYKLSKRFEYEILSVPDNLMISFPLLTPNDEVLFFYQTKDISDNWIVLDYIDKVTYRNRINNEKRIFQFQELSPNYKTKLGCDIPFEIKTRNDYLLIEDRYYDLHEDFLGSIFTDSFAEKHQLDFLEYLNCFYTLVPEGSLLNAYIFLAKDFFDFSKKYYLV